MSIEAGHPRRWWWAAWAVGVLLLAAGVTTLARDDGSPGRTGAGPCREEDLDLAAETQPVAVSPDGKHVLVDAGGTGWAVKHDGESTRLGDGPGGSRRMEAVDVNDSGTVVGTTGYAEDVVAWIYEDGEFRRLEGLGDSRQVHATAVNGEGVVVGFVGEEEPGTPVRWDAGATEASPLPLGEYESGTAVDISDDGTIVGSLSKDGGAYEAWLWRPDGSGRSLLPDKGRSSEATGIAGDWALLHTDFDTVRVNIYNGFQADTIEAVIGRFIDERGRVYGNSRDWNAVVHDGERIPLPGLDIPPKRQGDDPDQYLNALLAVAVDGSVVYGKPFNGDTVKWACD